MAQASKTYTISSVNPKDGSFSFDDALNNVSFAGADIVATIVLPPMGTANAAGDYLEIGDLQTVSYSIHREKDRKSTRLNSSHSSVSRMPSSA